MGRGLGCGYKNIVQQDPYIHSLSAKGVKTHRFVPDVMATRKQGKGVWTCIDCPKHKYTEADYKKVAEKIYEAWSEGTLPPSVREIIMDLKRHPKTMDAHIHSLSAKGVKTIYKVTAIALDRKTKELIGSARTERINVKKNELFKNAKNKEDVKDMYEAFWDINPNSKEVVKVINIDAKNKTGFATEKALGDWYNKQMKKLTPKERKSRVFEAQKCPECGRWHNRIGESVCVPCQFPKK